MMPENPDQRPLLRPPVGNLTDFVEGVDEKNPLDIEVAVNENGKIVVFHNRKFRNEVSWFEFDLGNYALDFVMDEGEIRNAGVALTKQMAKYMQNSHQILMVLLDNETGQAAQGNYIPLIIHQN
jgi:hypothetical protein